MFAAMQNFIAKTPFSMVEAALEKLLQVDQLDRARVDAGLSSVHPDEFCGKLLDVLEVDCQCSADDLRLIPRTGPVVVSANHPFGMIEGAILGKLMLSVRKDVKFLANSLLGDLPELRPYVISINPFGGREASKFNSAPLRESILWLKKGGLLVVFPAGEVSALRLPNLKVDDPAWSVTVSRLIRITKATTVPVFFPGRNGSGFQVAGLIHPRLRTALLPRELMNKRHKTISLTVGAPVSAERLARLPDDEAAIEYLRRRTYLLQTRRANAKPHFSLPLAKAKIAAPTRSQVLQSEINQLPASQKLVSSGDYSVYIATAEEIPDLLREIGRLREITFRAVGEGTGKAVDIDRFDKHYRHMFIWDAKAGRIAGAYRLAGTDEIVSRFGQSGLYTSTLFRFDDDFMDRITPALELGRSFVAPDYQKSYSPLLLLWKGIGAYVGKHPRYRKLFGPVSISSDYGRASQELMVSFLRSHRDDEGLAASVKPRKAFRERPLRGSDLRLLGSFVDDASELSELIADVEPDRKGIPILLRQYLNLGGQILEFNVDRAFSNVLDGLILVDLIKTDRRLLDRYLGKVPAEAFLAYQAEKSSLACR